MAKPAASQPPASEGYKRLVLALLLAAYTFNFIDRTIIATIGQAIKVDLKITDAQLGLLGGLYFALLYTLLGIPIARLAERFSRVNIIALAVVIWSGFTTLCGTAAGFGQLALYRFGVGVGEAGCSPPAHSLISDYFPPKKRASALAVYSFGIPLGTMIGAAAGGWLAQTFSWRLAFVLVGVPGVIVALLIKLLIREPVRGGADVSARPADEADLALDSAPKGGLARELSETWAVAKLLFGKWSVFHMVAGVTLASFAAYGSGQFVPPYFIRTFGLGLAQVGLIVGIVGGFSAGVGTLAGGFVTDALAKRSPRWYALTPAIGLAIAAPLYLIAYSLSDWKTAALILLVPGIFHYTYLAPTFGVVQNMVEVRRRATATALLFFVLNLIGLGGGPPFTGWLIDQLAAHHFGATADAFKAACPGGLAPAGAPAEAMAACKAAVTTATRHGILITICIYFWAALHYLLGSFGLVKTLAAARAARGESLTS